MEDSVTIRKVLGGFIISSAVQAPADTRVFEHWNDVEKYLRTRLKITILEENKATKDLIRGD